MERLASIVAELVSLRPDVIVVGPNTSVRAVMQVSITIPIEMAYSAEPVANGLVASLARPAEKLRVLPPTLLSKHMACASNFIRTSLPRVRGLPLFGVQMP